MKKKKESYFSEQELLRLEEILSDPSFWKEHEESCKKFDKEIDEMTKIPIHLLREPMTI